jgi:hypothetical protein
VVVFDLPRSISRSGVQSVRRNDTK